MDAGLRVNSSRLELHLDRLASLGALPDGGVCRLAFSAADKEGRDYVEARMRALGLEVRIDRIGNITGIRAGRSSGPVVMAGSHTDTVATGGRFDGSVGVMGALEVIETLNEAGVRTRRPLAVTDFVNEEGARFTPDMMGSLAWRGDLTVEEARRRVAADGRSVGDDIDRHGFAGPFSPGSLPLHSYLELHIEQGPVLEQERRSIGVVTGVQGIRWIGLQLRGASSHAGATPIAMRRDAAYVAGGVVQYARKLSAEIAGQRATVGSLTLSPNIVNVVAEEARLTVDLRNPDAGRLHEADERLRRFVAEAAAAERIDVRSRLLADVAPVQFDPAVIDAIEHSAESLGYPALRLLSGAGHDAQIMAAACPTAMIFVPSRGGISHNTGEFTPTDHIAAGANVLLHTLLALTDKD